MRSSTETAVEPRKTSVALQRHLRAGAEALEQARRPRAARRAGGSRAGARPRPGPRTTGAAGGPPPSGTSGPRGPRRRPRSRRPPGPAGVQQRHAADQRPGEGDQPRDGPDGRRVYRARRLDPRRRHETNAPPVAGRVRALRARRIRRGPRPCRSGIPHEQGCQRSTVRPARRPGTGTRRRGLNVKPDDVQPKVMSAFTIFWTSDHDTASAPPAR